MIINNFRTLHDRYDVFGEDQKSIYNMIYKLVDMIDDNIAYFGVELRKVVERIFLSISKNSNVAISGNTMNEKIRFLRNKYYMPTNILHSLHFLKDLSNRESHWGSNNRYRITIDHHEAKNALKSLWFFMKWIIIEFFKIEDDFLGEYEFRFAESDTTNIENLTSPTLQNLNNDMDAEKMTIFQLISLKGYNFNIPTYQRDYSWDESHVLKFLSDIEDRAKDNKTHYFGSLAVAIDKNKRTLRIIDGQQRITTSLLILKAFYQIFKQREIKIPQELKEFVEDNIRSIYINQEVLESQKAIKLILNGQESNSYSTYKNSTPFKNFELIKKWMEKFDEYIIELYSVFSTKIDIAILVFKTSIDNEMDIFENLNTGGTNLRQWDLIRSYIFSRFDPNFFLKIEKDVDKKIIEDIIAPVAVYNKSKKIYNTVETFFTLYNRYMSVMKLNKISKNRQAHEEFKRVWPKYNEKSSKFQTWNKFNEDFANIKKNLEIFIQLRYSYQEISDSKLHPYSHIISLINRDDAMPLLIHAVNKFCNLNGQHKITKVNKQFINVIRVIETYFIRTDVYGNNLAVDFDKFLLSNHEKFTWIDLFNFLQTSSKPMRSLDELQKTLAISGKINHNKMINILTHIEHKLRNIELGAGGHVRLEKTHEHIIAKNLSYESYDDHSISQGEFEEIHKNKKDSIGNALLLSQNSNSRASNKPFSDKKQIFARNSYLARGNDQIMNLLDMKTFTYYDVDKRAKQISKFVTSSGIYLDKENKDPKIIKKEAILVR